MLLVGSETFGRDADVIDARVQVWKRVAAVVIGLKSLIETPVRGRDNNCGLRDRSARLIRYLPVQARVLTLPNSAEVVSSSATPNLQKSPRGIFVSLV